LWSVLYFLECRVSTEPNIERLNEAFSTAQGETQNPFAKLGNIEIILATPHEILSLKNEIIPKFE